MQSNDARILRGAAIPTGIVGLGAIAAGLLLAGAKGALGSAIGAAVVLVFFTLGVVVVSYVTKISQQLMLMAGLLSFLIKFVAVLALIAAFKGVTAWNAHAFGWTVIALTLVWLAAETNATLNAKVPYAEAAPRPRDSDKSGG
jgi:ATP synthase protein I